jgi:hypothetical protein
MSTAAQPWDIHLDMACPECDRLENEFKVADAEFIGALSLPLGEMRSIRHIRHGKRNW